MVGQTLSHYKIISKLGAGGMGEVYLAEDLKLGRQVALKILPPQFAQDKQRLRRFTQEARSASALNHPHIVHIYEVGESEAQPFIVMEYAKGKCLDQLTDPLKIADVVSVAIQVANALQEAHSKGIIHRDLKPSNIMLTEKKDAKILDFGLAKVADPRVSSATDANTISATEPGAVLGTLPYMSPEQALGGIVDQRSDLFSFGAVLYELIAKRRAFDAQTPGKLIDQIAHQQPESIARWNYDAPPELERIVRKCMEKDPERRYQSAADLLIDLKNLQRDTQTVFVTTTEKKKGKPWIIYAVALIVVTSLLIFFYYRPLRRASNSTVNLAVLPFTDLTASKNAHFGLAIADAVITRLSNLKKVRVAPTSSILRFQTRHVDVKEVRQKIKVDSILTGTLQRSAGRFRVSVQLIRTSDNTSLWGESFELPEQDLLRLEDEISQRVVSALNLRLNAEEKSRLYRRYTENTPAYESYLYGRAQLLRYQKEGILAAVNAFEKALSIDQNFALAHAGLASAFAEMHLRYASAGGVQDWARRAHEQAATALRLDPNLAEAHLALASVYRKTDFDWDLTISESKKAIALNENLDMPHYYIAAAFYHLGLTDLVEAEIQKGLAISSENRAEALRTRGISLLVDGEYQKAVSNLEELQWLSDKPISDTYLAAAYYYVGNREKSMQILNDLTNSTSASAVARSKAMLAAVLAAKGDLQEAQSLAETVSKGKYMDHHVAYSLGLAFAQLNDPIHAIDWLNRAAETGLPCYPLYAGDPLLRILQNNAQFQALLLKLSSARAAALAKYGEHFD